MFQFFCSLYMWFSVLMVMVLSWYEPADALRAQDGVESKACDEKDREDQQPVNGLHWDAGQRALVVCIPHHPVSCGIKPFNSSPVKMGSEQQRNATCSSPTQEVILTMQTCLVSDERVEHLQSSVCVVETSHGFGPLEQEDVGHCNSPKPCGEADKQKEIVKQVILAKTFEKWCLRL